jgi:hypothetical protein
MWFAVLWKSEFGAKSAYDCAMFALSHYFENYERFGGKPTSQP